MKSSVIAVMFLIVLAAGCKKESVKYTDRLIPEPKSVSFSDESFAFTVKTPIVVNDRELLPGLKVFRQHMKKITGKELQVFTPDKKAGNGAKITVNKDPKIAREGYVLKTGKKGMEIYASTPEGVFYAIQTFMQLCPLDIYKKNIKSGFKWQIPGVDISDGPEFAWRGMMLDVSRHFFTKEEVLKLLNELSQFKLNTFHIHLVDDQGWRIEIKKYPKLTSVGAWRVDREDLPWNGRAPQKPGEKATYGGFYTQDDIKEIVSYAKDRFITVIPEIEMPGHTTSSLAAYPQYSCTGGPFTVLPGGIWPITDIYCAGNDSTFIFLENVLTEVMELFPSKYIHIGGDEATKTEWKKCKKCQKRIRDEHLKGVNELQSYFIKRIERFLNENDRILLGWDEILEGGLAPKATVMSWRGMKGGIEAAKSGHDVVMTPTSPCYFDYYQGDVDNEPEAFNGHNPLSKVYKYKPVPEELNAEEAKHVLGGQANLWTEYVPNAKHMEYMTFPRILAIAETLWSPASTRNWTDFAKRVEATFPVFKLQEINYAQSVYNVKIDSDFDPATKKVKISLSAEMPGSEIRYTINDEDLVNNSKIYTVPFELEGSGIVRAAVFKDGKPAGTPVSKNIKIHKATGSKVTYLKPYSKKFTGGGDGCLVNSLRGSKNFSDKKWQAFERDDCELVIDLGKEEKIGKITVGCLHSPGSWIFLPTELTAWVSNDGKSFRQVSDVKNTIPSSAKAQIVDFELKFKPEKCRYVKMKIKNLGEAPEWHSAPGSAAWLFVDEIIVE